MKYLLMCMLLLGCSHTVFDEAKEQCNAHKGVRKIIDTSSQRNDYVQCVDGKYFALRG